MKGSGWYARLNFLRDRVTEPANRPSFRVYPALKLRWLMWLMTQTIESSDTLANESRQVFREARIADQRIPMKRSSKPISLRTRPPFLLEPYLESSWFATDPTL